MKRISHTALAALALLAACPSLAQDNDTTAFREKAGTLSRAKTITPSPPQPEPPPVVQDYEPRPAMWRLADADTTIYLFGTFHILPAGFRWRTQAFDRALEEAGELVVETSDSDGETIGEAVGAAIAATIAQRGPTSQRLAPENLAKWRTLARMSEVPFEAFDRMPLLFALFASGLSLAEMQGSTHDNGVETILEAEFAESGRPVLSIEDPVAVVTGLLAVDDSELVAEIDAGLSKWDGQSADTLVLESEGEEAEKPEEPFADEHAWAQGRSTPVFTAEELDSPTAQALYDVLLTQRNTAWAEWLGKRLDRPGTVFVAVGAGHFDGADSVIVKLADRGLTAERVQ